MVTMRTQMTVKTSRARTPPITAYGTALVVSTTALGSKEREKKRKKGNVMHMRGFKGTWAERRMYGKISAKEQRGERHSKYNQEIRHKKKKRKKKEEV